MSIALLAAILWTVPVVVSAPQTTGQTTGGEPGAAAGAAADAAIDAALRARQFERAVELIDGALRSGDGAEREYLLYRRGLALLHAGRADEAIAQLTAQVEQFPRGAWADKARFRIADAHAALRRFDAAERIYAERVRELIGEARKAEQARVLLELAEAFFAPGDPLTAPDFARALTFYEKALEIEPGPALRDGILIRRAECHRRLEHWEEAAGQFEQYLLIYDEAFRAQQRRRQAAAALPEPAPLAGGHVIEARLRLGECRLRWGSRADARRALQDLLDLLERADARRAAHREAWTQAMYLLASAYGVPEPESGEMLALGVQTLERMIAAEPGSEQAVRGAYEIGQSYAHLGRHDEAVAAFQRLCEQEVIRPGSDATRELAETLSQQALFRIGELRAEQRRYDEAIGAWTRYVAKYPSGPQWAAAQERIRDAEYQIAADAFEERRHDAAREAWNAFLARYPLDERAPGILYALGEMLHREEKYGEALAAWRRLVAKYPGHEESGRAQLQIGLTCEEKLGDLEAAIEAYRKLDWSSFAPTARQRHANLSATRLLVHTPRVYRTDEPARVRVDVRNVDRLSVRVYRLDMHDYFRRSHSLGGVEGLDLLLIDPDQSFDLEVPGYARWKPISHEVEIPLDGAGVCAVYVTNEKSGASPERLEATTLVIRSDIDVIIKSSRRQVLVFAQDMRAGSPAAGVNVLVSDGARVRLEGVTGPDGVWSARSDELARFETLSVFARRDGHVAGNALSLRGLEFSTGLTPRGYLHTDRPAYRPGEAVNIRGVLREVQEGRYVLPARPEEERLGWKLDVSDAKGRVLQTFDLALDEFGTFATQFRIAGDAPVGKYGLVARRAGGPSFAGGFRVEGYQLPQAFLRFQFDQRVVIRGEKITGRIEARYHYGEPVVGKAVEFAMHTPTGDDIALSGVTAADGTVAFEFDSTMLPEEGRVAFTARQADLGLEALDQVFVAVRAFRARVDVRRPLYLAEEPVEAVVTTTDLRGEPLAQDMTVTALLRTMQHDRWAETKVESAAVRTDEKTGVGRVTFRLVKGGQYVLRAEGQDRFGHVVDAETLVSVSDDEDEVRLRVFSDRQHYRVGETIALDVHSRVGTESRRHEGRQGATKPRSDEASTGGVPLAMPAGGGAPAGASAGRRGDAAGQREHLALVTFEGEEIIGYRTVALRAGHNPLEIAVGHEHFPNFAVGVSVMAGNRLHAAARDFTVERQLRIALKPDRESYRPRDEMTIEVTATDQQGVPVRAEVALAMVDQALLARYPDQTPDIADFFQEGAERRAALRTESSCTFAYAARTRAMVGDVLAEAQRVQDEAERTIAAEERVGDRHAGAEFEGGVAYGLREQLGVPPGAQATETKTGRPGSPPADANGRGAGGRRAFGSQAAGGMAGEGAGDVQLFEVARDGDEYAEPLALGVEVRFAAPGAAGDDALARLRAGRAVQERADKAMFAMAAEARPDALSAADALADVVRGAPPRSWFPEVAYWNPRIITGEDGRATVRIVVPDSSTKWTLIARGATVETLVGQSQTEVVSRHDFFVELLAPAAFVQGDRVRPTGRVHCLADYRGKADVTLRVRPAVDEAIPAGGAPGSGAPAAAGQADAPPTAQTRTIEIAGSGVYEVEFEPIELAQPGRVMFELEAAAQDVAPAPGAPPEARPAASPAGARLSDALVATRDVRPWGMRVEEHVGGIARDSDFVEIELPAEAGLGALHDVRLTVAVGASLERWLIEEALEAGGRWEAIERDYRSWRVAPARSQADTAAALLGCLYAADYVRAGASAEGAAGEGAARPADLRLLTERGAGLAAKLLAGQNDDGGWSWSAATGASDPWTTAQVAWALGKARRDGLPLNPPALDRLRAYLEKVFADARPEHTELKSVVLHGLAWLGEVDYAHANRLHRNRETLSNAALAHLALTFVRLDRKAAALEVLALLDRRARELQRGPRACRCIPAEDGSAWMGSELEVTALALLAQVSVDPAAAGVPRMVDYLAASARTDGWRPHKARGAVIAALCTWYARGRPQTADFTLAVSVNGRLLRTIRSGEPGSVWLELAGDGLAAGADGAAGRQRVEFRFDGRGEYAYAVTLSGFAKDYPKPLSRNESPLWARPRWYAPPVLEYGGRPIAAGFDVAARYEWFGNHARHVAPGGVVSVRIDLGRHDGGERPAGDRDYVIVQESIPPGFRLLTDSVSGSFDAFDYSDHVLTVYCGSRQGIGPLCYRMVASTPGTYRVPPTIIRSLYSPGRYNLSPANEITVLRRGEQSPDPYRMTPDELWNLGRLNFDDGRFEAADALLRELLAGDWWLKEDAYRESVRMLLSCALRRDDAAAIVNYFEILKEKYPDLVIPFADIVRVADAYARSGQHERAYVIHRATADASFVRDSSVAGALRDEGRFLDSLDFLTSLWRVYPDTPQVSSALFAASQALYAQADQATALRPRRAAGSEGSARGRVTRAEVIRETIGMLERFLALYPDSPIADEASYSLANAYLDLDDYRSVVARTEEMIARFDGSKWLDRFRYLQALAWFNLSQFDRALELAEQVAAAEHRDEQGVLRPSPNRWLALYIIGQIHHARQDPARAIEYYKKVREEFSDADEAVRQFEHKFIQLPEVTVFHPDANGFREAGEWERHLRSAARSVGGVGAAAGGAAQAGQPATPAGLYAQPFVRVDYRNVKSAVIQVYRVDLMKLALVEKNLTEITSVNLAGIRPILERTVELGDGFDYVDRSRRVALELPGAPAGGAPPVGEPGARGDDVSGAFLVICRGEDLFSSGLVLVTPLTVEVQEDLAAARARVSVLDAITRAGVRSVHVKLIGSAMDRFLAGETDLRGVYLAEGVSGYPTAIARDPAGHFAFYRSEGAVLAMAMAKQPPVAETRKVGKAVDYRGNLRTDNVEMQRLGEEKLKGMFKQQQRGVQVRETQ